MSDLVLVTFDIDGTILKSPSGCEVHSEAIKSAAVEICGLSKDINIRDYIGVSFAGRTDSFLTDVVLRKSIGDYEKSQWNDFRMKECEEFRKNLIRPGDVLPGVPKMIEELSKIPYVRLALCTGNYEPIAWRKLESASVDHYFKNSVGGFGEHMERVDILRDAIRKAEDHYNCKFSKIVHIGDAIQDVTSAQQVGAQAVAVETGGLKREDYPQPCLIVENLEKGFEQVLELVK